MNRVLALAGLLAGCDVVYSLDRPIEQCWNRELVGDDDGDGIVNGCDTCPAGVSSTDEDTDFDHILDPCDPSPQKQHLVDFAGFFRENDGEGWAGPSWAATMDLFGHFDPTAPHVARKAIPATLNPSIEAPIAFGAHDIGSYAAIGFMFSGVSARCSYEFADGSDRVILSFGSDTSETSFDAGPGLRLRFWQSADGVLHCRAFDGVKASTIVDSPALLETSSVLATVEATGIASLAWIMIIGADSPTR